MTAAARPTVSPTRPDVAALYRDHREAMHRAARRYLVSRGADPDLANDAVNTVITRILANAPSGVDDWRAYLVRGVLNAAKDMIKKMNRSDQPARNDDVRETIAGEIEAPDAEEELMTALRDEQQLDLVLTAIEELPESQRRAVRGRLVEARSNVDIAPDLGVTPQQVSNLYYAGIRAITRAIPAGGDAP